MQKKWYIKSYHSNKKISHIFLFFLSFSVFMGIALAASDKWYDYLESTDVKQEFSMKVLSKTEIITRKVENIIFKKEIIKIKNTDTKSKLKQKLKSKLDKKNKEKFYTDGLIEVEPETPLSTEIILENSEQFAPEIPASLVQAKIPENTYFLDDLGNSYTGAISAPVIMENTFVENLQGINPNIVFVLGDLEKNIYLRDSSGNPVYATIQVNLGAENISNPKFAFSNDGVFWEKSTSIEVFFDGNNYIAEFQVDHFTFFTLGSESGEFTIANDAIYTNNTGVTLNANISGATQMRFGNSLAERDSASRETYNSTKSRYLTDGDGTKTVYAEFANGVDTGTVEDSIVLDSTAPELVWTGETPDNNTLSFTNTFQIESDISELYLDNLYWSINSNYYYLGSNILGIYYTNSGAKNLIFIETDGNNRATLSGISNLVLSLQMDNNPLRGSTGNTVGDRSNFKNNASKNNVIRTGNGLFSGAYIFNGVGSHLEDTANVFENDIDVTFTLSMRIKTNNNIPRQQIISKRYETIGVNNQFYSFLDNGLIYFLIYDGNTKIFNSDISINNNEWYHLAISRNSAGNVYMYINGQKQTGTITSTVLFETDDNALFGKNSRSLSVNQSRSGMIDNINVFNTNLSDTNISQLYQLNTTKIISTGRYIKNNIDLSVQDNYTYQICGIDKINNSSCSESRTYSNKIFMPLSPTNESIFESNNVFISRTGDINYNSISGVYYEVSTSPTFSSTLYSGTTTNSGVNINVSKGAYYRKVKTIDLENIFSDWSETYSFTTQHQNPTISLVSPNDGTIYTELDLALEFTGTDAGGEISGYLYEIYNADTLIKSVVTYNNQATVTGLQSPNTYTRKAKSFDYASNFSERSELYTIFYEPIQITTTTQKDFYYGAEQIIYDIEYQNQSSQEINPAQINVILDNKIQIQSQNNSLSFPYFSSTTNGNQKILTWSGYNLDSNESGHIVITGTIGDKFNFTGTLRSGYALHMTTDSEIRIPISSNQGHTLSALSPNGNVASNLSLTFDTNYYKITSSTTQDIRNIKLWDSGYTPSTTEKQSYTLQNELFARLKGDESNGDVVYDSTNTVQGIVTLNNVTHTQTDLPFIYTNENGYSEYHMMDFELTTYGATDWEDFYIDDDLYLFLASDRTATTNDPVSKLFKRSGDVNNFVEYQTIATNNNQDRETFEIDGDHYAISSEYGSSYPSANHHTQQELYKRSGSQFVIYQNFVSTGVMDHEYFNINGEHYLASANRCIHGDCNIESHIYKRNGSQFSNIQDISTKTVYDIESFSIDTGNYIVIANKLDYSNSSYNTNSVVYKRNGSQFVSFQNIPTNGASSREYINIDGEDYLLVANNFSGTISSNTANVNSVLYKFNGTNFVTHQNIPTEGAYATEAFNVAGNNYLAISSFVEDDATSNTVNNIYIQSGNQYELIQKIPGKSTADIEYVAVEGQHYLFIADRTDRANSTYTVDNQIFKSQNEIFVGNAIIPRNESDINFDVLEEWLMYGYLIPQTTTLYEGTSFLANSYFQNTYEQTSDLWTTGTIAGNYESGSTITYTITYGNSGFDNDTATLSAQLSGSRLSGIDFSDTRNYQESTNTFWTGLTLTPNQSGSLYLTAVINTGTLGITGYNFLEITGNLYDLNTSNNTYEIEFLTNNGITDTTPPTISLISPTSGLTSYTSTTQLIRSGSDDNELSGYEYQILSGTDIILSGTKTVLETGVLINFNQNGNFTRKVKAFDTAGNFTRSEERGLRIFLRNNDQRIDDSFRDANPISGDIIYALYGDGNGGVDRTAYTDYRSENDCLTGNLGIEYLQNYDTSGLNSIPQNLSRNTIYILTGGTYITTGQINFSGNCTTIISEISGTTIYSNTRITNMLYNNKNNNIIDNVKFDGLLNGIGGNHTSNSAGNFLDSGANNNTISNSEVFNSVNGVYLNSSNNNTLNNIKTYKNTSAGIYIYQTSSYNTIKKIISYKNSHGIRVYSLGGHYTLGNKISDSDLFNNGGYGIYLMYSWKSTLNNIKSYNNIQAGLMIDASSFLTINNSQFYNNNNNGIWLDADCSHAIQNNTYNNLQIYNNKGHGFYDAILRCSTSRGYNTLNNIKAYNNLGNGVHLRNSTGNIFYGNIEVFGNAFGDIYKDSISALNTGGMEKIALGFTGGIITGGKIDCTMTTNSINTSGQYFHDLNFGCDMITKNTNRNGDYKTKYLYGKNIAKQSQPVEYNASNVLILSTGLSYDSTKYIAESNRIPYATVQFEPKSGNTTGTSIQLKLQTTDPINYILTGDFEESGINGSLTDSGVVDITLTANHGVKYVYAIFSTGTFTQQQVFAKTKLTDESTMNSEKSFISGYFASGTEYTKYRTVNQCNPDEMLIHELNPGTNNISGNKLEINTIYLLNSGTYSQSNQIVVNGSCIGLIGSGNVNINNSTTTTNTISTQQRKNFIVDTIKFNTNNQNNSTILLNTNSSNNTISNISIQKANSYGIYFNFSYLNTINKSKIFNNNYGIYINNSYYNKILNSDFFKNKNNGIHIINSSQNQIQNIKSFNNNGYGIYSWSPYNTINNCQIFNNINGATIQGNNKINNSYIYNNSYGAITNVGDNRNNNAIFNNTYGLQGISTLQFGTGYFFNNINYNYQGLTIGTTENESIGRTGGIIIEDETRMSCDRATIGINSSGQYFHDLNSDCGDRLQKTRTGDSDTKYLYGQNIAKQIQPVYYDINNQLITGDFGYDPEKFIGEREPRLPFGTIALVPNSGSTASPDIQLELNVTDAMNYTITGDIQSIVNGSTNSSGIENLVLTNGTGMKYIYVTFSTGSRTQPQLYEVIELTANPRDELVDEVFCSGSRYNDTRSYNQCCYGGITVQELNPGTGQIPLSLKKDTIYVLNSGNYINTGTISIDGDCIAIIGSGEVTLYTTGQVTQTIYGYSRENVILENLKLDGKNYPGGTPHTANGNGIGFFGVYNNSTINKIKSYNNGYGYNNIAGGAGSRLYYTLINNSEFYNNATYGIYYTNATELKNNVINSTKIFNNTNGVSFSSNGNGAITNSIFFNNGIGLNNYNNNFIHNSLFYNNVTAIKNNTAVATLSDLKIFNNLIGIDFTNLTNQKFYNTITFQNNVQNFTNGTIANLSTGGIEYSGIGRTSGNLSFSTIPYDIKNLITSKSSTGFDFQDINSTYDKIGYNGALPTTKYIHLIGSNIAKQTYPVYFNNSGTLVTGNFQTDTNKYISETDGDLPQGTINFEPNAGYITTANVNIKTQVSYPMTVTITGNFAESPITTTIESEFTTGITLNSTGTHYIYATFYTGGFTQSTVRDKIRYTDESTKNYEQNLIFDRRGNPEYTNNRSFNACDTGDMIVETLNPGTNSISQNGLEKNTLYLLNSGAHITTGQINFNNSCLGLLGLEDVSIYSNVELTTANLNSMILLSNNKNIVLENIRIDGLNNGLGGKHTSSVRNTNGIQLYNYASNNTIYNIQSLLNGYGGLINKFSFYNFIEQSQFYNNTNYGIQLINTSRNNIINNTKSFNNARGIVMGLSTSVIRNTISNSQIFNNSSYGIYLGSTSSSSTHNTDYNTITNTNIFNNNSHGIYLQYYARYNNFNNLNIYNNNGYGIYNTNSTQAIDNKYYGINNIYNNLGNLFGTITAGGTEYNMLNRTTGSILTPATTMFCDYFSDPVNRVDPFGYFTNGVFLSNPLGSCNTKGIITRNGPITSTYYGDAIPLQQQPVKYNSSNILELSNYNYNTGQYIAEYNILPDFAVYSTTGRTTGTVDANLNDINLDRFPVQNNGGSTGYTFTQNGIFDYLYYDNILYQTGTIRAMVNRIDNTLPRVVFTGQTPVHNFVTTGKNFTGSIDITESRLKKHTRNRNGNIFTGTIPGYIYSPFRPRGQIIKLSMTDYTDPSLIFAVNLDKETLAGETATTVKDFSYLNNTGTVTIATRTGNGKIGGAYDFVADTSHISFLDKNEYTLSANYTVFARINPDNIDNDNKAIIGTYDGNGFILALDNSSNNILRFRAGGTWVTSNYAIAEDGNRKQVSYTKSGTIGTFYVDGVAVATVVATVGTNGGRLQVGGAGTDSLSQTNYKFDGLIDDVRIYNRALTSGEIRNQYASSISLYTGEKRQFDTTMSGLADGNYPYQGCAEDGRGRTGCTETRNFIVDTTAPDIYFTGSTPASGTVTNQTTFTGQVEIIENNLSGVIRKRNGTDYLYSLYGQTFSEGFISQASVESNGGTVSNVTFENGQAIFSGTTTSYISYGNPESLNFATTSGFSIKTKAYINPNNTTRVLVSKRESNYKGYVLFIDTANNIYFTLYKDVGNRLQIRTTSALNTSGRYDIVATYDGSSAASGTNIYINGILQAKTIIENTLSGDITNNGNFEIGIQTLAPNKFPFDGKVDTIEVYNYPMTSQQVADSYNKKLEYLTGNIRQYEVIQPNLTDGLYTYQACAEDVVGLTDCTETRNIMIDTISPLLQLISPLNHSIFNTGYIPLLRSGSDERSGLSGFVRELYSGGVLYQTGWTTQTGVSLNL